MFDEPDTRFFRCVRCHAVFPEYRWTPTEKQRVQMNGRASICDACEPLVTLADPRLGEVWGEGMGE
jgi:uncharacterized CHY-type Zn-finger protein